MTDHESGNSRRDVLKGSLAIGGGFALSSGFAFMNRFALAQGEELVPFSDMTNFSNPPKRPGGAFFQDTRNIDSYLTPNEQFYVVQHYNQPEIAEQDHLLRITGLLDNPLELDMAAIRQRPKTEIVAGFECGGNGPAIFNGLIGNARWGGISLRDLLEEVGLQDSAAEIVFYGADRGTETIRNTNVEQSFARSLSRDEAMLDDIILAYEMNGEPLPRAHGAPLRLIVPGWYGVANVKWLEQIHVQDRRFAGKYMARDYVTLSQRDVGGEMRWEERLVSKILLKSAIVRVTQLGDDCNILGFVLNDGTPLQSVEVKIDDGPWQEAEIVPGASRYSWKLFSLDWPNPTAGEHRIVSRVTDVNGQVQPTQEQMPEKVSHWENNGQFTRRVMIG